MLVTGCAPMPESGTVPQEQRSIEVPSTLPPPKALELVQAAALRGGWTVAEANGVMVQTDAYTLSTGRAFRVQMRANAVSAGTGSVIYVTGRYGNVVFDNGVIKDPIVGGPFGRMNRAGPLLWAELERFATAVRAATADR